MGLEERELDGLDVCCRYFLFPRRGFLLLCLTTRIGVPHIVEGHLLLCPDEQVLLELRQRLSGLSLRS